MAADDGTLSGDYYPFETTKGVVYARAHFSVDSAPARCIRIEIRAGEPSDALSKMNEPRATRERLNAKGKMWRFSAEELDPTMIREVPVGKVIALGLGDLTRTLGWIAGDVDFPLQFSNDDQDRARILLDRLTPERRPGPPARYGPEHYRLVAEIYLANVAADPLQAVRNDRNLGGPVSKQTASRWIRKARDLELLDETRRGRVSGAGPRLRAAPESEQLESRQDAPRRGQPRRS